ncbi:hypothetical protein ACFQ1M_11090 [Sungkyunkwania multivorans]|uniref:Uncharacterized protein n=1 Tax=Sungkyunkwania multivorans TaxID=1173618 RepID=A0ABW3CYZ7_9FLAO
MKQTISRNDKNLEILNNLITSGCYNGYVSPEKFELTRNRFPNNHRLIGVLNDVGSYDLKFVFKYPINVAAKILLVVGILVSMVLLVKGGWMLPMIFVFFGLIIFVDFKIKEKKEIHLLIDKLLEFHKAECN